MSGYRIADLARRYPTLALDEDYFVNYGYLSSAHSALLHPRRLSRPASRGSKKRAAEVLAFAREREEVHPRMAATHFAHGSVANYWGGTSNATTRLLDEMHYEGLLRVRRRDRAMRVYEARAARVQSVVAPTPQVRADALVNLVIRVYAPLTACGLSALVYRLRRAAPPLAREFGVSAARAKASLAQARVAGAQWFWPGGESPEDCDTGAPATARFLAPFDPIVWDRARFEQFWGWSYRFEAYTPSPKRKLGYYALPLLWCDRVVGWGNLSVESGSLKASVGYVSGRKPAARAFRGALEAELQRFRHFLRLDAKVLNEPQN